MTEIVLFEDLTDRFYDLYNEGEYRQALALLVCESARFPDYAVLTNWFRMRMLAQTGDAAGAIRVLDEALARGDWYHEDALHNMPDLVALQGEPEFEELVTCCKERRAQAIAEARPSLTLLEPRERARPWPLLLHLRATNLESADYWQAAADVGWLVAIPQSSQVSWFSGLTVWDDTERALAEIQQHCDRLFGQYELDRERVAIAGFSRHAQAALKIALGGVLKLRGFIGVEAWLPDASAWLPIVEAHQNPALRGYFIAGKENAEYYEAAENMVELLSAHGIACELEGTSNERHRFPPEFGESLARALNFICTDNSRG